MTKDELIALICLVSVVFIIITFVVLRILYEKKKKIIKNTSKLIHTLLELNKKYSFNQEILKIYKFCYRCRSKREYDKLTLLDFFTCVIQEQIIFFEELVENLEQNNVNFNAYLIEYKALVSDANKEDAKKLKISLKRYLRIVNKLYKELKLHPIINTEAFCKIDYLTPAGRNYYHKEELYNFNEISGLAKKVRKNIELKKTRSYQIKMERLIMTDSLRYDILKRDNFRCQICGASSNDGIKLHVDHIIPISKGGKTVESNLRALCDRCNLGKKDKLE